MARFNGTKPQTPPKLSERGRNLASRTLLQTAPLPILLPQPGSRNPALPHNLCHASHEPDFSTRPRRWIGNLPCEARTMISQNQRADLQTQEATPLSLRTTNPVTWRATWMASNFGRTQLSTTTICSTDFQTTRVTPNGERYPRVGGMRQRHFAGTNFKPCKLLENAATPTRRVHAVLGCVFRSDHTYPIRLTIFNN